MDEPITIVDVVATVSSEGTFVRIERSKALKQQAAEK